MSFCWNLESLHAGEDHQTSEDFSKAALMSIRTQCRSSGFHVLFLSSKGVWEPAPTLSVFLLCFINVLFHFPQYSTNVFIIQTTVVSHQRLRLFFYFQLKANKTDCFQILKNITEHFILSTITHNFPYSVLYFPITPSLFLLLILFWFFTWFQVWLFDSQNHSPWFFDS